jgi:hydroxypyruvate isomerase
MPRFAANISTMYPDLAFLERIGAAAADGFAAVEVQGPYQAPAAEFALALRRAKVQLVLMNAPAGNAADGDRGIAALAGREREFEAGVQHALDYALTTGAPRVHIQAGRPDSAQSDQEVRGLFVRNLAYACDLFAAHGITVMVEPINTRDIPGYYVTRPQQAVDLIDAVDRPNIALQLDLYHLQIVEGDLSMNIERFLPRAAHVQIAGVPQRHEPDVGEVSYPAVFALLDRLGYSGWVGCEYRPARGAAAGGTSAGLGWLRRI